VRSRIVLDGDWCHGFDGVHRMRRRLLCSDRIWRLHKLRRGYLLRDYGRRGMHKLHSGPVQRVYGR
jgi:hypothetical protein